MPDSVCVTSSIFWATDTGGYQCPVFWREPPGNPTDQWERSSKDAKCRASFIFSPLCKSL